jgi:hypothetical protein
LTTSPSTAVCAYGTKAGAAVTGMAEPAAKVAARTAQMVDLNLFMIASLGRCPSVQERDEADFVALIRGKVARRAVPQGQVSDGVNRKPAQSI